MHYIDIHTNVALDKNAGLREQRRLRLEAKKQKRFKEYRPLVELIADGGELTSRQIDLLEQIADELEFDPVDDFALDVEKLAEYRHLSVITEDFESKLAAMEEEWKRLGMEAKRLKLESIALSEKSVQAELAIRNLTTNVHRQKTFKANHPRLFPSENA